MPLSPLDRLKSSQSILRAFLRLCWLIQQRSAIRVASLSRVLLILQICEAGNNGPLCWLQSTEPSGMGGI